MKKLMKSLLSMTLILSVAACSSADNLQLEVTEITVEYGEALSLEPKEYLAEDTSEDILSEVTAEVFVVEGDVKAEDPIDTDGTDLEVGNYILSLSYNDEVEDVNVTVSDTTAPEFVDFNETVTFVQGESTDLTQLFKTNDLSAVEVTVEGNVDFNTAGTYPIKVTAKDEYENATEKDCSIVITEKEVAVETPNTSGGSSGGSSSSNSSSGSSNSSTGSGSNNSSNTGGSSNTGNSGSSSSGSSNTGSSGSGGSTTPPSQPEVTECQHEYSNVGSTGILTDEYPGELAQAIFEGYYPESEYWHYYVEVGADKAGGGVDVYPVRCEKCKQSVKYTINIYTY